MSFVIHGLFVFRPFKISSIWKSYQEKEGFFMRVTFSQFCSCGPEVREALRSRIDDLGGQGRSYEFPDCRMPEGCVPQQAVLGFLKRDRGYLLYWRPAVAYQGTSGASGALTATGP